MARATQAQRSYGPLEGLLILVVEDNPDGAELLRQMAVGAGAEVVVAPNGLEGLRMYRQYRPAVVLSDLRMPGMDGYELVGEIRAEPGTERVPVIAVTAYGSDTERLRTWSADFDAHVVKPVDFDLLVATIQRVTIARRPPPRAGQRRRSPRRAGGPRRLS
jgi:CheY-like chemotaxis protein